MTDVFFQLILICLIYTCNIKVKKSMEFLVWVGKTRSTQCTVLIASNCRHFCYGVGSYVCLNCMLDVKRHPRLYITLCPGSSVNPVG